jgi:ABC-type proline/glycine betaine transport system ATPase subunit
MFAGRDLATLDEAALAQFRAEMLGFVFQSFNLIDDLTIEENVALGLTYRRPAWPMRVIRCWRPWIGWVSLIARAIFRINFLAASSSAPPSLAP